MSLKKNSVGTEILFSLFKKKHLLQLKSGSIVFPLDMCKALLYHYILLLAVLNFYCILG